MDMNIFFQFAAKKLISYEKYEVNQKRRQNKMHVNAAQKCPLFPLFEWHKEDIIM